MNRRLFKLLHTDRFGLLQQDPNHKKWSRPTLASFVDVPIHHQHSVAEEERKRRRIAGEEEKKLEPQEEDMATATTSSKDDSDSDQERRRGQHSHYDILLQKYVDAYIENSYQKRLMRLYNDLGGSSMQDPEEWAKDLYVEFRNDPNNIRALTLNYDRKVCLNLLYDMVNEWMEHGYSVEFEHAMARVFSVPRMVRILYVCLVMDRAQALYKMKLPSPVQHGGMDMIGMHWYSESHVQNDTFDSVEEEVWWKSQLLKQYPGKATMNKRLYRLLYSPVLKLQQKDPVLARWAKPQAATFVYQPEDKRQKEQQQRQASTA